MKIFHPHLSLIEQYFSFIGMCALKTEGSQVLRM